MDTGKQPGEAVPRSPIAVVVGAPRRPLLPMHRSMARWLIGRPNVQAVVIPS
jgi:hypothetical protein